MILKLQPDLALCNLAVIYKDNLIIGDVQLGFEEALETRGVLVPRFQLKDILGRLERIFEQSAAAKIKRAIINGDLKHEFGTVTTQEWRESWR